MLKDRLDKYLKEKLDANPEWDKEALWADIENAMEAPNKRRFGWWWIGVLIGLLVLIGVLLNKYSDKSNSKSLPNSDASIVLEGNSIDKPMKERFDIQNIEMELASNDHKAGIIQEQSERLINQATSSKKTINSKSVTNTYRNVRLADAFIDNGGPVDPISVIDNKTNASTAIDNKQVMPIIAVDPLEKQFLLLEMEAVSVDPYLVDLGTARRLEPILDNVVWHQLKVYAGIGFANRMMKTSTGIENGQIDFRNANEQVLENRHLGILFRKRVFKNWHISTGINYREQHEKLNLQFTSESIEQRNKMDAYSYTDSYGATNFIAGEVNVTLKQDFDIQHFNVLRSIDIPLLAGFYSNRGRWGIVVEGGPSFNVSQSFTGRLFDSTNEELSPDLVYSSHSGISLLVNTEAQYMLGNNFSASVGFGFSRQFGSSVLKDQLYALKYARMNINTGLIWTF